VISALRKFLKGWSGNLRGEFQRNKEEIRIQIRALDENESESMLSEWQYHEIYRLRGVGRVDGRRRGLLVTKGE